MPLTHDSAPSTISGFRIKSSVHIGDFLYAAVLNDIGDAISKIVKIDPTVRNTVETDNWFTDGIDQMNPDIRLEKYTYGSTEYIMYTTKTWNIHVINVNTKHDSVIYTSINNQAEFGTPTPIPIYVTQCEDDIPYIVICFIWGTNKLHLYAKWPVIDPGEEEDLGTTSTTTHRIGSSAYIVPSSATTSYTDGARAQNFYTMGTVIWCTFGGRICRCESTSGADGIVKNATTDINSNLSGLRIESDGIYILVPGSGEMLKCTSAFNDITPTAFVQHITGFTDNPRMCGKFSGLSFVTNDSGDTYVFDFGTPAFEFYVEPTPPTSNICFPAGTLVNTDQGEIQIQKIVHGKHTINGKRIVDITKTVTVSKYLVQISPSAIGPDVPSRQTVISERHKLLYKGKMVPAESLVGICDGVKFVDYTGETLYNVLLEKHGVMNVNSLICESVDPSSMVAKLYSKQCKYPPRVRDKVVSMLKECRDTGNTDTFERIISKC
jgi:hypothetical protein